jgi:hypothetical protein
MASAGFYEIVQRFHLLLSRGTPLAWSYQQHMSGGDGNLLSKFYDFGSGVIAGVLAR